MYTYTRLFVGVPLSQKTINAHLTGIGNMVSESDMTRCDINNMIAEYLDEFNAEQINLLQYIESKKVEIDQLNEQYGISIDFFSDYNGDDDSPVIFGAYVDHLFRIPSTGCDALNTQGLATIEAIKTALGALFQEYHGEFPVDFYANNHSS